MIIFYADKFYITCNGVKHNLLKKIKLKKRNWIKPLPSWKLLHNTYLKHFTSPTDFSFFGRPTKFDTDNICVEFLNVATVVNRLLNDGIVLQVVLLLDSRVAIIGTLTSKLDWEDCKRVLTTSSGQVTTAPTVPANLQEYNYILIQHL